MKYHFILVSRPPWTGLAVPITYCFLIVSLAVQDDAALLTVTYPDPNDPSHFALKCSLNPNRTSLNAKIAYAEISKIPEGLLAVANSSYGAGLARSSGRYDIEISGQVGRADILHSSVRADFRYGTCEDAGTYSCKVLYAEHGTSDFKFTVTQQTIPNACSDHCVQANHTTLHDFDLNSFSVACSWDMSQCPTSQILDLELFTNSDYGWSRVANLDVNSTGGSLHVDRDFSDRGVSGSSSTSGSSSKFMVTTDAGVYRCKMTYIPSGSSTSKVVFAETRLPECNPGAFSDFYKYWNNHDSHYYCRVDPSIGPEAELISLDVSTLSYSDLNRTEVAFINKYINGGHAVATAATVDTQAVDGLIDPHNATNSYLQLPYPMDDTWATASDIITCKAVYLNRTSGNVVVAIEEGTEPN
ncbi:hypothetical protein BaRGS_00017693 [Batillaria attramentaria]|uniref:Ig-like domain-containing protein n=1 Tax=Batillaria attramentaria TaxID=370345 RepID=A0ABD0KUX1_9CAEN